MARDRGSGDGVGLRHVPRSFGARGAVSARGRCAAPCSPSAPTSPRKPSCWAASSAGRPHWSVKRTPSPKPREAGSRRTGPSCSPACRAGRAHAARLIDATIQDFTEQGQGTAVQYARWARSSLLNGLGRYPEAMAVARDACDDTQELFVSVWAATELLEAATRRDNPELARAAFQRVAQATSVATTDWAVGIAGPLPRAGERR